MMFELVVDTLSLVFASGNLILLLAILSVVTSVAEAPKAWSFLTFGLSMIVMHFSLNVFMWTNPLFDFYGMQVFAALTLFLGFVALLIGTYDIWEVIEG